MLVGHYEHHRSAYCKRPCSPLNHATVLFLFFVFTLKSGPHTPHPPHHTLTLISAFTLMLAREKHPIRALVSLCFCSYCAIAVLVIFAVFSVCACFTHSSRVALTCWAISVRGAAGVPRTQTHTQSQQCHTTVVPSGTVQNTPFTPV